MYKSVYISLGSNLGGKFDNLQNAVNAIYQSLGRVVKVSPVYKSESWGFDADDFYNAVIIVETTLTAHETLNVLLRIEKEMGRQRSSETGFQSRIIDLDILFFEDEIINTKTLVVPHPHIEMRNFVLQPLADVAPSFIHPRSQKSVIQLCNECVNKGGVEKANKWLKNPHANFIISTSSYIAIEGNIGAGKTSLASMITRDFNAKLILERFADNPFLPKFYNDKARYAFPLEMSFLADRYQQLQDDLSQLDLFKDFVVSDYDVYKSLIFAKITLQEEELRLYKKLFYMMYKDIAKPELYVYLYQNTNRLLENIKARGRSYEASISGDYLNRINKGYLEFINGQQHLNVKIIDVSDLDFVKNRGDYLFLLSEISRALKK